MSMRDAGAGTIVRAPTMAKSFGLMLPQRDVQIWLPPSYSREPDRRYPVVYAHDGQKLMANSRDSWQLGSALSELCADGLIEEPIVVMIDNVQPNQPGDLGPYLLPLVRRR